MRDVFLIIISDDVLCVFNKYPVSFSDFSLSQNNSCYEKVVLYKIKKSEGSLEDFPQPPKKPFYKKTSYFVIVALHWYEKLAIVIGFFIIAITKPVFSQPIPPVQMQTVAVAVDSEKKIPKSKPSLTRRQVQTQASAPKAAIYLSSKNFSQESANPQSVKVPRKKPNFKSAPGSSLIGKTSIQQKIAHEKMFQNLDKVDIVPSISLEKAQILKNRIAENSVMSGGTQEIFNHLNMMQIDERIINCYKLARVRVINEIVDKGFTGQAAFDQAQAILTAEINRWRNVENFARNSLNRTHQLVAQMIRRNDSEAILVRGENAFWNQKFQDASFQHRSIELSQNYLIRIVGEFVTNGDFSKIPLAARVGERPFDPIPEQEFGNVIYAYVTIPEKKDQNGVIQIRHDEINECYVGQTVNDERYVQHNYYRSHPQQAPLNLRAVLKYYKGSWKNGILERFIADTITPEILDLAEFNNIDIVYHKPIDPRLLAGCPHLHQSQGGLWPINTQTSTGLGMYRTESRMSPEIIHALHHKTISQVEICYQNHFEQILKGEMTPKQIFEFGETPEHIERERQSFYDSLSSTRRKNAKRLN